MATTKKPGYAVWCVTKTGYGGQMMHSATRAHRLYGRYVKAGMRCALYLDGECAMAHSWQHDEVNPTTRDRHYAMLAP